VIRQNAGLIPLLTFDFLEDWVTSDIIHPNDKVITIPPRKKLTIRLNSSWPNFVVLNHLVSLRIKSILAQKKLLEILSIDQILLFCDCLLLEDSDDLLIEKFQEMLHSDSAKDKLLIKIAILCGSLEQTAIPNGPSAISRHPKFIALLLKNLPIELNRRSMSGSPRSHELSSAQWLMLSCVHPKIGLFIAREYFDMIHLGDLFKIKDHYSSYSRRELNQSCDLMLQHLEGHLDERAQMFNERMQRESEEWNKKYSPTPKPTLNDCNVKKSIEHGWGIIIFWALLLLLALLSAALILMGIGGGVGFAFSVSVAEFLFSSLPFSAPVAAVLTGFVAFIVTASAFFATYSEEESDDYDQMTVPKISSLNLPSRVKECTVRPQSQRYSARLSTSEISEASDISFDEDREQFRIK
jgi:hypothetical protein